MPTVSSTVGSPTRTCWKRRSSAGSDSMCLRYSSSVVAPTMRSSPRASIGLIMLPASMADSPVAPAPTIVCSSSMKVMTWPAESVISCRTALSRSSNSPRYFAPATIEPMSRATTRLLRSDSGTSPAMIRCARPSTIAVLPTPGSPMSTGLFLVRRDRTWTTRRISASRPTTGSRAPDRARSVRSWPYFSRAWKVPSGSADVIRPDPRTFANASWSASGVAPWRVSTSPVRPPAAASPTSRCSVETYSSPMSAASCLGVLEHARGLAIELRRRDARAARARQAREDLADVGPHRRRVRPDRAQQRFGEAVGLVEQRGGQMGRRDLRVTVDGGRAHGGRHRLLGAGGGGEVHCGGPPA